MDTSDASISATPGARGWRSPPRPAALAATAAIVACVTLAARGASIFVPPASAALLFVVAVLLAANRYGFWAGIVAAALAFLSFNFFFVEPFYTLRVARPDDAVTLGVLLFAAIVTGLLAGRAREESDAAKRRASLLEHMAEFAAELGEARGEADVEELLTVRLARIAGAGVLLKSDGGSPAVARAVPAGIQLEADDFHAAARAARHGGRETGAARGWAGSRFTFQSFADGRYVAGCDTSAARKPGAGPADAALDALLLQAEGALDRIRHADDSTASRAAAEREALRAALLSSLSHDLKTPLATIVGAASSLRELDAVLQPGQRRDLLAAIDEEAARMSRHVTNLLQMTRLQSGLSLRLEWSDAADAVNGAVQRVRRAYPGCRVALAPQGDPPLVRTDPVLLEQAFFNILENAVKFSPPGAEVAVEVAHAADTLTISIADKGAGIAPADLARVFEPFYRGGASQVSGTGLGLTVARGIVQALGGTIAIRSPGSADGGTTVEVALPCASGAGT